MVGATSVPVHAQRGVWLENEESNVVSVTGPDGGRRRFFPVRPHAPSSQAQARVSGKRAVESIRLFTGKDAEASLDQLRRERAAHQAGEDGKNSLPRANQNSHTNTTRGRPDAQSHRQNLWVDTYRPRSFGDLLGDSFTNRQILRWLMAWKEFTLDKTGECARPRDGMVLISGSPGIGKTALTQVLCAHVGFRPFEVNASDVRSRSEFENKVLPALESRSILSSLIADQNLPTCVILDELDGACGGDQGGSLISALLQVLGAPPSTERRGARRPQNVPIIAICNDARARALRPIKARAPHFEYVKPDRKDLVARLEHIMKREELQVDRAMLFLLCDMAACDVRSALNTLQLLRYDAIADAPNAKPIASSGTVLSAASLFSCLGCKDIAGNVFGTWDAIFSGSDTLEQALDAADLELVVSGCFENASTALASSDPRLQRISAAYERHAELDAQWSGIAGSPQTLRLAALFYSHFCARPNSARRWTLPIMGHAKRSDADDVEREFDAFERQCRGTLAAHAASFPTRTDLILDYVPSLHSICAEHEGINRLVELGRAVQVLCAHGISISPIDSLTSESLEKGNTHKRVFVYDPDLDRMARINDGESKARCDSLQTTQPCTQAREQIWRMAKVARNGRVCNDEHDNTLSGEDAKWRVKFVSAHDFAQAAKIIPCLSTQSRRKVVLTFHEGHTNAVKKAMVLQDFL